MATVRFEDVGKGIYPAVERMFGSFGGGRGLLKSSGHVFIKVNGVDNKPHVFTSPEVVEAAVRYFFRQGAKKIFVMENCTQGSLTRMVFEYTGMTAMCKRTGAIPLYLDETGEVPIFLPGVKRSADIPDILHEQLIKNREKHLYISMPKLKSHSMSTITLGIKNQMGLLHQKSRIPDHNYLLHQKVADIFHHFKPDFVLVDGLEAINHGHYPAVAQEKRCVAATNLVFGGDDPLAVDVVGARFLGFNPNLVKHLMLAAEYGSGETRFDRIRIENPQIFEQRRQRFTSNLLERFPGNVKILRGKTRCCPEGCKRNTETVLEVFGQDFGGKGGFTILMGKDISSREIREITGPVHIAGDCAIGDWYPCLEKRLGKKRITVSAGCNNLASTIEGLRKWMEIPMVKLLGKNPIKTILLLIQAKLHGSKARIPALIDFG